jgi:beta-mannosidase
MAYLSECSVKFTKNFQLGVEFISKYSKALLKFEGIDTYSTISFNGVKLGTTENAFLMYEFDIKPHIKLGNN